VIRFLVLIFFLVPQITWGQSSLSTRESRSNQTSLPACQGAPFFSFWDNCVGSAVTPSGNYEGQWRNSRFNGFGVYTWRDGSNYIGEFRDGAFQGRGIKYHTDGRVDKSGTWENDVLVSSHAVDIHTISVAPIVASAQNSTLAELGRPPSLSPCPANGAKHNCFGSYTYPDGRNYVGEFSNNKFHGIGTYTYSHGGKYVGGFNNFRRDGEGVMYRADGTISSSGRWESDNLVRSYSLDINRFPFDPSTPASTVSLADPSKAERDRLAAEVEAERKKRQELEAQLAEAKERERLLAEAKERERQQAQAPQPQRPQAVLRNERRLALIIGNSSYKVSPLDNPANDATDIAESLKKFGFQTTLVRNATLGQMREATRRFADQLPSADVALIYFAGHGIEANRKNYMIPVNADLKFEYELADQGYDAGIWLEMLESIKSNNADRVNIVILDACRNNSLIGSRNLGRGLGKMDAPSGTFLAYSTAPGKVAADGGRGERNSPFTKHLLRAMQQPNQPIEEVFKEVRRNVGKETNGAQVPWESTSLTGFFAFRTGGW
jgi:hypothetical protein